MARSRSHDLDGLLGHVALFDTGTVFVVESRLPGVPLRAVSGHTLPPYPRSATGLAGYPSIYRQNVLHIETPAGDVQCTVDFGALPGTRTWRTRRRRMRPRRDRRRLHPHATHWMLVDRSRDPRVLPLTSTPHRGGKRGRSLSGVLC
jgi:hypothetical protein